jgi:hypothetical protein
VILFLFSYIKRFRGVLATLVIFSMGWILGTRLRRRLSILFFFVLYLSMLGGMFFREKNEPAITALLFYSGLPPLGSFFGKLFVFFRARGGVGLQFIPLLLGLMMVTS